MSKHYLLMFAAVLCACSTPAPRPDDAAPMNRIAETYVRLVLAVGQHDPLYVDAYYGPAAWRTEAAAAPLALARIAEQAQATRAALAAMPVSPDPLVVLRQRYLLRQLDALLVHTRALQGERLGFDAQARALYDVVPPPVTDTELRARLAPLAALLPGDGTLAQRYNAYLERFAIPPKRLETVMRAAIEEARRRTARFIDLPPGENFELVLVRGQPWSAYNWYQGGYRSRIEINTDLPVTVARALELAVHEGYPGHHVYNCLLEKALVRDRGWIEYSVYPLFSPQSLIAEGSADYALELTFPRAERIAFLRDVLFPLAGFDPAEAQRYVEVTAAADVIGLATIAAAREFLDGRADAAQTRQRLQDLALASPARAAQRVDFFRRYGSYIVNYALGEALVARYVEARAGSDPAARWRVFAELLASPRLPSDLRAAAPDR
ncbi:hypothetical protein SAMN04488120_101162 [Fontimonas thermophila]|uniref:DUF885 domain-containing protein n=1 Tax=Fontimonas thermophila TaxID=1076937 RepID=A0A1I2H634_9GAMM|nr:hypothetical protein [Fontimonas thermophila]SFF24879.1 hypothetical protein SAMN04488120_101162 [Fontimonas thermophila]